MRTVRVLAIMFCVGSWGCAFAPSYEVSVDSISSGTAELPPSYVLLPGNDGVSPGDLRYQEFAVYVRRALAERGYVETTDPVNAPIAVVLSYGIGDPQEHVRSKSIPVWGQTGVSSSTTRGTATTFGNISTYSGTTTHTPKYGVTGYRTVAESQTTFFRFMILDAYDLDAFRARKDVVALWNTTVTSRGSSGDLRQVFPILVAASKDHFASNTGKQVTVNLTEHDPRVIAIVEAKER